MSDNQVVTSNFELKLNGSFFSSEQKAAVMNVAVEEEINLPSMFVIKFNIVDFDNGTWRGIDLKAFKPGDEIKVSMGMDNTIDMITGEITSLELTFGDASYMEIRGYDRLHKLRFGTKRRSFREMKDSDVASSIASEHGLSPQVVDTGITHPYVFQNNQSNYEFIRECAERINYVISVSDKNLYFKPSQEDRAHALTLEYGRDIENFTVQLRSLIQGTEVEIRGWDIKNKKEIIGKASSGSEKTIMAGKESGYKFTEQAFGNTSSAVSDEPVTDSTDANGLAKARYNAALREFITGEGRCNGNPDIRAGNTVEIKGLGNRFSGIYYVISTVHTIGDESYVTTFKVRRTGI